jgi:hypothetical protein
VPARYRPRPMAQLRRTRRRTEWFTFAQGGLSFTTGQTRVFDLLADAAFPLNHGGMTVVRTRGVIQFNFGVQGDSWTWGTIVTRLGDIGTAAPSPVTTPDLPWLWIEQVFAPASAAAPDEAVDHQVDIKSRRRIHAASETYAICVTNNSVGTHNASFFLRALVQLP